MKQHIKDTKTGINYTLHGEYYLPDLSLPAEEEIPIGVWGERHKQFLKTHQRGVYNEFLVSGKLQKYLAQIDRDAQDMFDVEFEPGHRMSRVTGGLHVGARFQLDHFFVDLTYELPAAGLYYSKLYKVYERQIHITAGFAF